MHDGDQPESSSRGTRAVGRGQVRSDLSWQGDLDGSSRAIAIRVGAVIQTIHGSPGRVSGRRLHVSTGPIPYTRRMRP